MILVIDNYDSFTYNLVQYLGELGADVQVVRNDAAVDRGDCGLEARAHRDLPGARAARAGGRDDGGDPAAGADGCRFWACAWGTRRLAPCSAGRSCARPRRCTARRRRSSTTAAACSPASRARSPRPGTTRSSSPRKGCRPRSRSPARTRDRSRDHGHPAPPAADSRRPVPPGVDLDRRGPPPAAATFSAGRWTDAHVCRSCWKN